MFARFLTHIQTYRSQNCQFSSICKSTKMPVGNLWQMHFNDALLLLKAFAETTTATTKNRVNSSIPTLCVTIAVKELCVVLQMEVVIAFF